MTFKYVVKKLLVEISLEKYIHGKKKFIELNWLER